jgi:hypothetical protein
LLKQPGNRILMSNQAIFKQDQMNLILGSGGLWSAFIIIIQEFSNKSGIGPWQGD